MKYLLIEKEIMLKNNVINLAKTATISAGLLLAQTSYVNAGVFEVIHPDVKKGEYELEFLNGANLDSVDDGEERSEHELALGYSFTDNWKLTGAIEIANPAGESLEVEGFELQSVYILPFSNGKKSAKGHDHNHNHEHAHGEDKHSGWTLGILAALEIPEEDGFDEGAFEIGPIVEATFGPFLWVGNLVLEVPFGDEDPGLGFASQTIYPVTNSFGIGVESFGAFEELFGDGDEEELFAGPALYFKAKIGNSVLEPRVAVLFGLNDETEDAILSFNLEYKFGG